ncbi:MAG: hypothetical protein QOI21_3716, partial [Actinomycetota bacterium]|nr:hypothetical protein [Actinomycetota bacterium]
ADNEGGEPPERFPALGGVRRAQAMRRAPLKLAIM